MNLLLYQPTVENNSQAIHDQSENTVVDLELVTALHFI